MNRLIRKDKSGNIACNGIIIHTSNDKSKIGKSIRDSILTDFKIIHPKYYRYTDDNAVLEIWYDKLGMLLSGKIEGYIGNCWTDEKREEITYEEAMSILEQNKDLGYNNKDLMSIVITNGATAGLDTDYLCEKYLSEKKDYIIKNDKQNNEYEEDKNKFINGQWIKSRRYKSETNEMIKNSDFYDIFSERLEKEIEQNNNGGATDYYSLPKNANTLQDLIEHRNMNGSVKDIFKACYRLGIKTEDELRDLNKMAYYSLREVGRITSRKDYITIAKELMGSQTIEKG